MIGSIFEHWKYIIIHKFNQEEKVDTVDSRPKEVDCK